jgi:hypothetical protein
MFDSPSSWDVIIAGASFAGLAAAVELAVGASQTSACATPLLLLERLGLEDSVEQVHDHGVLHPPNGRAYGFRTRYPFATFDYAKLCRLLFARSGAESPGLSWSPRRRELRSKTRQPSTGGQGLTRRNAQPSVTGA